MVRFSVLTLTYGNRANPLKSCIESVLNMSKKYEENGEIEYIIVDNASCRETIDTIKSYTQLPGSYIKHVRLDKNIGVSARNAGLDICTGSIICQCDDDIIVQKNDWINKMMKYMSEDVFMVGPSGANFCGWDKGCFGPQFAEAGKYVDWITGYLMMYRNIKGYRYDPNLWSLRDESDLGLQAKVDGWRLRQCENCGIHNSIRNYGELRQDADTSYFYKKWQAIEKERGIKWESQRG